VSSTQQFFETNKWHGDAAKYQSVIEGDDSERLKLAFSLVNEGYHHLECESVNATDEQRSFCFHHNKVTDVAILAIHGWTACPFEMREMGQHLFQQDCNVFGVRLAGHGTEVKDFARYGQQDWERSTQKGLAIATLLGRKVIIVGESMGGALAAILAATFPELVDKIILCAPSLRIADRKAEYSRFRLLRLFMPTVDFGDLPDWQKRYWYSKIPTTGVAELLKVARKARRLGPSISSPILIIQATNDQMVNPKGALQFYHTLMKFQQTEKQLIFFEKGHHNLTVDLNPQKNQVIKWISEFID
jgi:carboxylesterase